MQLTAQPKRFPGQRRARGTNWGLCNEAGNWLHCGPNIVAFNTAQAARNWLADPAANGKDQAVSFRHIEAGALAQ